MVKQGEERLQRLSSRRTLLKDCSDAVDTRLSRLSDTGNTPPPVLCGPASLKDNLSYSGALDTVVAAARTLVTAHAPGDGSSRAASAEVEGQGQGQGQVQGQRQGDVAAFVSLVGDSVRQAYEEAEEAYAHALAGLVKRQFHEGGFMGLAAEESAAAYSMHELGRQPPLGGSKGAASHGTSTDSLHGYQADLLRLQSSDTLTTEREVEAAVALRRTEAALAAVERALRQLKQDPSVYRSAELVT